MTTNRTILNAAVGDCLPNLHFGPITRAMLARYAAASLDFNPIHIDADFAVSAGQGDVIAHGMLTFGLASRLVAEWAGPERISRLTGRFTAITHVGDVITVSGHVRAIEKGPAGPEAVVELAARVDEVATVIAEAWVRLG